MAEKVDTQKTNSNDEASPSDISKPGNGISEALLVEEYPKLSAAVQNMMFSLKNPTVEEVFICILYIIIVETGFIPYPYEHIEGDETCRYNARRLKNLSASPKRWLNKDGVYVTYFVLSMYPQEKCTFFCDHIGNYLAANMYNSRFAIKNSLEYFNPRDYVALYPNHIELKKMKDLAHRFKNNVAIPMRTVMSNEFSQASVGLFALPVEVLLKMISYLKVKDFLRWSSTCKYFHEVFAFDENIWKRYCHKTYCGFTLLPNQTHREHFEARFYLRNKYQWNLCQFIRPEVL